jgi:metallo-beta-lactamase class B
MSGRFLAAALVLAASAAALPAQTPPDGQAQWAGQCHDGDAWDKAGPPFRIWGNTYYVGTCGIASILIVGDQGDVLIDGGPEDAGDLVAANIRKLGIDLSDVRILLHTHEHHDHAGGLARLKQLTGARLYASKDAALALEKGAPIPDDPQYADHGTFPAVRVDKVIKGGAKLTLGNLTLNAFATPGHTPGALTWQWRSCAGTDCRTLVYADSLSPVSSEGYRFRDHPEALSAYRASLIRVASLKCDIVLSPHPSASGMRERLLKGSLLGTTGCYDYANGIQRKLDARLAKEDHGG